MDLRGERASDVTKTEWGKQGHASRGRSMVRRNTKIMVGIAHELFGQMEDMYDTSY